MYNPPKLQCDSFSVGSHECSLSANNYVRLQIDLPNYRHVTQEKWVTARAWKAWIMCLELQGCKGPFSCRGGSYKTRGSVQSVERATCHLWDWREAPHRRSVQGSQGSLGRYLADSKTLKEYSVRQACNRTLQRYAKVCPVDDLLNRKTLFCTKFPALHQPCDLSCRDTTGWRQLALSGDS